MTRIERYYETSPERRLVLEDHERLMRGLPGGKASLEEKVKRIEAEKKQKAETKVRRAQIAELIGVLIAIKSYREEAAEELFTMGISDAERHPPIDPFIHEPLQEVSLTY
jgi:hypothetical protein